MKASTGTQLLNIAIAVGTLVTLWIVWSPWAAVLVLGTNFISLGLNQGVKSLEAGGE